MTATLEENTGINRFYDFTYFCRTDTTPTAGGPAALETPDPREKRGGGAVQAEPRKTRPPESVASG